MNTSQLLALAGKTPLLKYCLVGVYPAERLLSLKLQPGQGAIFNTDDSSGDGEHWVALYSKNDGSRAFFIDSYAMDPALYRPDWDHYLRDRFGPNLETRSFPVQGNDTATCGLHSLLGLMMAKTDIPAESVYSKTDLYRNDLLVLSYFKDNLSSLSLAECSLLRVDRCQGCLSKCHRPHDR
jgi:hypothetical protein